MLKLKHLKTGIDGRIILKDINIDIAPGEICMITGANGVGKSTLFSVIAGQLPLIKGKIILDAQNLENLPPSQRSHYIGRVFQDPKAGTIGGFSVWENFIIAFNQFNKRWWRYAYHRKTEFKALIQDRLGKSMDLDQPMDTLSGGQRQILNLIMTTLVHSPILLLDEHTAALDAKMSKFAMDLTRDLVRSQKLYCLMISHNKDYTKEYGDQTVELKDGVATSH